MFADDQVIRVVSTDALPISVHKLETVTSKYWRKILKMKTKKKTAFKGRYPVRSKIIINNNIIEKRAISVT